MLIDKYLPIGYLVILSRKRKKADVNLCVLLFNDVVRPVGLADAKFLGAEINSSIRLRNYIQILALKAEKRLNML